MAKKATRESYGAALVKYGENPNIVVLDADLSKSTKTEMFKKAYPERFINMGIAESNMMCVAAGLAASGKIAFASTFAMFAAGIQSEPGDAGPGEKTLLAVGRQHHRKETLRRQQTGSMLQQFTIRERIGVASHPASRMGRGQRIHEPRRIGNDMVIKQFGRDCCRLSFFGTVSGSSLFTAIRYARHVPAAPQGFRHPGTENPDSAAIHPDRMAPR